MERLLWTQVADTGPAARFQHAMVYDSGRDRVVLFGGRVFSGSNEVRPSDTWEWDGDVWVQVEDMGPPGRAEFAMAYDVSRARTVLFGGGQSGTSAALGGDTWEWDGALWTQVADTGPSARAGHVMAHDAGNGYVVLFSGGDGKPGSTARLETWAWDGSLWNQLDDQGAGGGFGAMAWNGAEDRVLLYPDPVEHRARTFAWQGERWVEVAHLGPDTPGPETAMAFDGERVVLFVSGLTQTWVWDGDHWVQRQDMGPSARLGVAMIGDTRRRECVLFGGEIFGDTWVLRATDATPTAPPLPPSG